MRWSAICATPARSSDRSKTGSGAVSPSTTPDAERTAPIPSLTTPRSSTACAAAGPPAWSSATIFSSASTCGRPGTRANVRRWGCRERGWTLVAGGRREVQAVRASSEPADFGVQDAVFVCLKTHSIAAMLPRLATLVGPDTIVVPAINGLPWWYFFREGGRFDGQRVACLDPAGTLFQALDPQHILGCVVHAAAAASAPGVVRHTAGRGFL